MYEIKKRRTLSPRVFLQNDTLIGTQTTSKYDSYFKGEE
ncbi:hypothetical protein BC781_101575 [Sediminitomix flava]|uniref:Uncharacterized protein n=1 Tax=Sediminitomix flava TaxID=379075 RepID=A0A315ZF89_SEDFL|nr:hypothetical protein BC781_101575 [Sediminitomix flava]